MGIDKIQSKIEPGSFLVSVCNDDGTYTPIGTLDSLESVDISDPEQEKIVDALVDLGSVPQTVEIKVKPTLRTKLFFLKLRIKMGIRHWLWRRQLKYL